MNKTFGEQGNISILLVDDEPSFLDLTKTYLEKRSNQLEIETCTSPNNALRLLEKKRF